MRIGALLLVMLLAGCSAIDGSPVETSVPTGESTPPATIEDDYAACGEVADLLIPVQEIVTGIVEDPSGGTLSAATVSAVSEDLRGLLELTSPKMDTYAAPFASVVLVLDDIYEGRVSGSQNLDTGAYRDAAIDILGYCVEEVGYSANG